MPPSSTSLKSVFGLTAKQHAQELAVAGVVTNKGRPRRASASRARTKEKSSPMLESQVTAHLLTASVGCQDGLLSCKSRCPSGTMEFLTWTISTAAVVFMHE